MVQKLLLSCAQVGDIKTVHVIVEEFLQEWKYELEEHGFSIEPSGRVEQFPLTMNTFQQKLMKEYFVLQCLSDSLNAKNYSLEKPHCLNPWVNILTTSKENDEYLIGLISILSQLCSRFGKMEQPH